MPQAPAESTTLSSLTNPSSWKSFITHTSQTSRLTITSGPTPCAAPASKVYSTLTDSSTYAHWSSVTPRVRLEPSSKPDSDTPASTLIKPGTKFCFGVVMNPQKPTRFVTVRLLADAALEAPGEAGGGGGAYYITWRTRGVPRWLLFGRRFWEIEEVEEAEGEGAGGCRLTTCEFQSGLLAVLVKMFFGARLSRAFEIDAKELAAYCESI